MFLKKGSGFIRSLPKGVKLGKLKLSCCDRAGRFQRSWRPQYSLLGQQLRGYYDCSVSRYEVRTIQQ